MVLLSIRMMYYGMKVGVALLVLAVNLTLLLGSAGL